MHGRTYLIFELITDLYLNIASIIRRLKISSEYIIDSFPVAVCENIRISRSKKSKGKQFWEYKASIRKYFYGYSIQVIATVDGIPVKFAMPPGSYHDIDGMKNMFFNLPDDSTLYDDSAYTDYNYEQVFLDAENINLMIARKYNSKQPHKQWENFLISDFR